jgi:hypothetical protein
MEGVFSLKHTVNPCSVFEEYPIGVTAIPYFDRRDECCSNSVRPLLDAHVECPNDCGGSFCNSSCFDWASRLYHKTLCTVVNEAYKQYQSIAEESGNEYYIVAARLLLMFPNAPWMHQYECPDWTTLDHTEQVGTLVKETEIMSKYLHDIMGKPDDLSDTYRLLATTVGMLRVNVLGLKHEDDGLGFALYSQQSLLNHSNNPNCQCVTMSGDSHRENPGLCMVQAIRSIAPGEELTIDYVSGMVDPERKRVLRYQYGIIEWGHN